MGLALVLAALTFRFYFAPLLFAIVLAVLFDPIYKKILKLAPTYRGLTAFLTVLIALCILLLPLAFLGIRATEEVLQLYRGIDDPSNPSIILDSLSVSLSEYFPQGNTIIDIRSYIHTGLTWILQNIDTLFSSTLRFAGALFVSLIAFYYFLKDGERIKERLVTLSPLSSHHDEEIWNKLGTVINSTVRGTLIVALVQGVLAGGGFVLFGVSHPIIWGLLTMIAALIPVVGTAIITIPVAAYLFIGGNTANAIGLFVWSIFLVGMIDNFIRPKLIGRGVRIHPFLILLSILGGLQLFGPIGFLAGPMIISFLFALIDIYPHIVQESKSAHE